MLTGASGRREIFGGGVHQTGEKTKEKKVIRGQREFNRIHTKNPVAPMGFPLGGKDVLRTKNFWEDENQLGINFGEGKFG